MMKRISKLLLSLFVLTAFIKAQTISQNVQFKDLEGNNYDLFDVLNSGKHVLCHLQYND